MKRHGETSAAILDHMRTARRAAHTCSALADEFAMSRQDMSARISGFMDAGHVGKLRWREHEGLRIVYFVLERKKEATAEAIAQGMPALEETGQKALSRSQAERMAPEGPVFAEMRPGQYLDSESAIGRAYGGVR